MRKTQPSLTSGGNDGCSVHYRDHRDPKRFGRTPGASRRLSQQQFRGGWSVPVHTSLKCIRDAMIRDSLWKSPEDHARPKIKRSRDHVNPRRHVVLKLRTPHAFRQRTSTWGFYWILSYHCQSITELCDTRNTVRKIDVKHQYAFFPCAPVNETI